MRKGLVLLLAIMLLSACGFHLRGMMELPSWFTQVSIISKDNDLEFHSLLKSQLEINKIQVCPDPMLAPYWLMINAIRYQKQIVSIGSSTNPRQYQLILSLEFCVQTSKGEPILPNKQIVVTRQLTVDNDRILGSNSEEHLFLIEMKQNAVIQLINRLGSMD